MDPRPYGPGAVRGHNMEDDSDIAIAYAYHTLSSGEENNTKIEKALDIVFGFNKFHMYLFGRRFVMITNHQPLTRIFQWRIQDPGEARVRPGTVSPSAGFEKYFKLMHFSFSPPRLYFLINLHSPHPGNRYKCVNSKYMNGKVTQLLTQIFIHVYLHDSTSECAVPACVS